MRLDAMVHEVQDDIRNRLFAHHLVESGDELRGRIRIAEEYNDASKELPDTLTPEEFERRFLAAATD